MKILIDGQTLNTYEIKRGIGRVFLSLINTIVNENDQVDWYITVNDYNDLVYFYPAVQAKLTPILIDLPTHLNPIRDGSQYSDYIQSIVDKYHISIYWNLNPLMPNVFFPSNLEKVKIHVMIHDLIPKILGYVEQWPTPRQEEYERRLTTIAHKVSQIVAISECTAQDLIKFYPSCQSNCSVIYHGINHFQFHPRPVRIPLYGSPYILYVGGFDPRKNVLKSLEAFSYLCHHYSIDPFLQFYVACDANKEQVEKFYQTALDLKILSRVKLLNEVSNSELSELYANTELFFFPSLYEGFGLPILEAMASGIITVASDIAIMREIGQEALIYCHPENSQDMADCLYRAITLPISQKQQLIQLGLNRASDFNWQKTADAYLEKLQSELLLKKEYVQEKRTLKIAFATPWPPEKSGIANYSYQLVNHLSQYCQISIFSNQISEPLPLDIKQDDYSLSQDFVPIVFHPLSILENTIDQFDLVVYQLGNDAKHHREIYKLAWQYPGIVILHDFYIYQFMLEAFANNQDHAIYQSAQEASLQYQAAVSSVITHPLPLCEDIVKRSKATVVHNGWIRQRLQTFYNVHLIHHGAELYEPTLSKDQSEQLRQQYNIGEDDYVIGMFGFVNFTKRLASVVKAVAKLYHKKYPIKLIIVGEVAKKQDNFNEMCKKWQIPKSLFSITGYVDDQTFLQLIELCDVYVGLRQPSMGETSGPLMKALGIGKPCIVSNFQQFAQLPDDICLKIFTDEREVPHLSACLEALLRQPIFRQQLSQNARHYIKKHATYAQAAKQYYQLFTQCLAV